MIDIAGIDYENMSSMPGLCVAIFTQGCDMNPHCKGCHNEGSWPIGVGVKYSTKELLARIYEDKLSKQVAWIGGEPLVQWKELLEIIIKLHEVNYTQMLFTGRTKQQLLKLAEKDPEFKTFLTYFKYIKAGPFIEKLKSFNIRFRGSTNQKIYVPKITDDQLELIDISTKWDLGEIDYIQI